MGTITIDIATNAGGKKHTFRLAWEGDPAAIRHVTDELEVAARPSTKTPKTTVHETLQALAHNMESENWIESARLERR